jgi:TolB-like protein
MPEIDPGAVRAHLDRITASRIFADSDRLRRFLRFTVESKLNAQHERVKEYVLGREVFDRADDYDPRIDPIVRVEARRLRAKLEEYYSGPGRDEKIRLEYQRGSYLPTFSRASRSSLGSVLAGKQRLAAIAVAIIIIAGASIALFAWRAPAQNIVAVVPARWIEPNPGDLDAADTPLAEAVDSELANRRIAPVLAWPLILQYQNQRKPLLQLAAEMGARKMLIVVVRREALSKRITVFLIDRDTGQKLRASTYVRRDISSVASQQGLARQIAGDLAKALQT